MVKSMTGNLVAMAVAGGLGLSVLTTGAIAEGSETASTGVTSQSVSAPMVMVAKTKKVSLTYKCTHRKQYPNTWRTVKWCSKYYAKTLMSKRQYGCFNNVIKRESGWRYKARNKYSGAYGLPQALPGSKMGKGWKTNPRVQVRWAKKYMNNRYGSPCAAWSFWQNHHWY
jgi:hypothetical protein